MTFSLTIFKKSVSYISQTARVVIQFRSRGSKILLCAGISIIAFIRALSSLPPVLGKQGLCQQRGMRARIGRLHSHGHAAGAK